MNRIDAAIAKAKAEHRLAFIGLAPIEPDSMEHTQVVADMLVAAGVDILMVHIPNFMPWMEGGVLQKAARAPRNAGVSREDIFAFIKALRNKYPALPLIDMTLYDTALTMGQETFIRLSEQADVDGFDLPNYPLFSTQDKYGFFEYCEQNEKCLILAISYELATAQEGTREFSLLRGMAEKARGFAFVMNAPGGQSGAANKLTAAQLREAVQRVKRMMREAGNTDCAVSVVCGISDGGDLEKVKGSGAECFMVGSGYVKRLQQGATLKEVADYVSGLSALCAY